MNNEEKILALLEKQSVQLDQLSADMADVKVTLSEHGARLDSIEKTLTEHGKMLTEHGTRLDSIEKTLTEHGTRLDSIEKTLTEHGTRLGSIEKMLTVHGRMLSEHGKMLAEHDARLDSVQSLIEHTIIPRLNTLNDRQLLIQETLARKEDLEELRDAMAEWEVANKSTYAEVWKRLHCRQLKRDCRNAQKEKIKFVQKAN